MASYEATIPSAGPPTTRSATWRYSATPSAGTQASAERAGPDAGQVLVGSRFRLVVSFLGRDRLSPTT